MSQDYHHHHQGIFTPFSNNGFQRSEEEHHVTQQIRRDKLRVQGFEPPLVPIEEDTLPPPPPVYETNGMLSEMFNFPPGTAPSAAELLSEHPNAPFGYRNSRAAATTATQWYGGRQQGAMVGNLRPEDQPNQHVSNSINASSMQLFMRNPPQATSSSSHPNNPNPSPSTLQMLLPNPNPSPYSSRDEFTWVPDHGQEGMCTNTTSTSTIHEIGGLVEGQGLSLSLSSSIAAKAEEFRMNDSSGMVFYNNQGAPFRNNLGATTSTTSHINSYHPHLALHNNNLSFGPSSSSIGAASSAGLRNSKYTKAAQELLEEFCSVGRSHQFKKNKFGTTRSHNNNNNEYSEGGNNNASSSSSKDLSPLSSADRIEHQRRKVKLLSMLDEVERRYNHYCEQMQMVVNSFDVVMGFGAAVPYTALAQKAMSRHFRCLKDAVTAQLKHTCELLGEKEGATGTSGGLTKGETPRLRMLEQSLRQQRAFHQMGMMEQEAWRPQRGLPERSVNILRAWLFEHFLHPDAVVLSLDAALAAQKVDEGFFICSLLLLDHWYQCCAFFGTDDEYPSDADKHLLARQTGLSRNQVSNWFINARVRLWKPMVEEMYQQEAKEREEEEEEEEEAASDERDASAASSAAAQTSTLNNTAATTRTAPKRSEIINAPDSDPSLTAINAQQQRCFSETQPPPNSATLPPMLPGGAASFHDIPPPPHASLGYGTVVGLQQQKQQHYQQQQQQRRRERVEDTCRRGSVVADYGTTATAGAADMGGPTMIRFGTTTAGDVSLTLGLRHAGNVPEKGPFSVGDFGSC